MIWLPDHEPKREKQKWSTFRGAIGRIRTSDPQLRKLMLYPAELRPQLEKLTIFVSERGDVIWPRQIQLSYDRLVKYSSSEFIQPSQHVRQVLFNPLQVLQTVRKKKLTNHIWINVL